MTTAKNYGRLTTLDQLKRLADKLLEVGLPLGFDVETGYLGPDRLKGALDVAWGQQFICGFSLTNDKRWARYVPLAHDLADNLPEEQSWEVMKPVLETLPVVAHNGKYEKRNLRALEQKGRGPAIELNLTADSMIEAFVLNEWRAFNLKDLVKWLFDYDQPKIESLFPGWTAKQIKCLRFNVLELSTEVVAYACEDAAWCLAIHEYLIDRVVAERKQMFGIESEIVECMVDVEDHGMAVAWDEMEFERQQAIPFRDRMEKATKAGLAELAGRDLTGLSLASYKQMQELLYRDVGLRTTRLTKGAGDEKNADKEAWQKMSTDKVAMEGLAKQHPAVKKLLELREVENALNRFDKWLDENHSAADSRIHPNFNQVVVGTGRFSADGPPAQQMPKEWRFTTILGLDASKLSDAEWAEFCASHTLYVDYWTGNFRDYVIAPEGKYFLGFDYSQIELRVLAGVSREPVLLDAFDKGLDVHAITAALMLGKPVELIDYKTERPIGKTQNFAIIYGMGVQSLAERLAIPIERAKELYKTYFAQFASITTWMQAAREIGQARGYAETPFGRKYTVWELQSSERSMQKKGERVLVNAPIQGGAADYMKMAMIRARRALIKRGWWMTKVAMVHNLHDALVFEVDNSVDPVELRELLQTAVVFPVPKFPKIVADWELGHRHGSCTPWKDESVLLSGDHWRVVREGVGTTTRTEVPESLEDPPEAQPEAVPVRAVEDFPSVEDFEEAPAEEPSDDAGIELIVTIDHMPTVVSIERLKAMILMSPGSNILVLRTPQGDVRCSAPCALTVEDQGALSMVFGGATVRQAKDTIDVTSLTDGIAL